MSRVAVFVAVGIVGMLLGGVASAADPQPAQEKSTTMQAPVATPFGTLPDGRTVNLWTLEVPGGWKATISEYGAILTSLHVPAKEAGGAPVDVVLGFDSVEPYGKGHPYFGATCGRVSNRIAKGAFELDGKAYTLATNNGVNHLHGGQLGFDKHLWKAVPHFAGNSPSLELTTVSPDGEEGYPGKLTAKVVYTLTPAGELIVDMSATTDAATIVNMVHHSYWNMAGQSSGHVGPQQLTVNADAYLPVDDGGIPTGALAKVEGTPFDFRPERKPAGTLAAAVGALPASTTTIAFAAGSPTGCCGRLPSSETPPAADRWRSSPISPAFRSTPATTSTARSQARGARSTASMAASAWKRRNIPTRSTTPTGRAPVSIPARPIATG